MKKLIILASLALFSACSADELPNNSEVNDELKNITVALSTGSTNTRVAVNDDASTDNNWKFEWENEEEEVAVWHNSNCTALSKFTVATYHKDNSSFTGSVSSDATKIRVISPYDVNNVSVSSGTYSIDISAQDGNLNKLYMMSDELITVEGTNVTGATPEMKHLGGFFTIDFKLENAEASTTYEITKVELSGVPTTMYVDMEGNYYDYSNMNSSATITATLSGKVFSSVDDVVEVRLNTLPFSFEENEKLTFDITYKSGSDTWSTQAVLENTYGSDIPFERAKFNTCTITIDPSLTISSSNISDWGKGNGDEGEELNATN